MKVAGAFVLGLLAFGLAMFVGETVGAIAAFFALAVYFFACQFLLSRGNTDALRDDWPVMLALDAAMIAIFVIVVFAEKRAVVLTQGLGMLVATCGGTYAGAFVASLAARRTVLRH